MGHLTIATLRREGFVSDIDLTWTGAQDCKPVDRNDEQVHFRADSDVDADAANCQHNLPAAYRPGDRGLDSLKNISTSDLICIRGTAIPIVFHDHNGDVYFASRTSLRMPGKTDIQDPLTYVDSCFFPYTVVPKVVRDRTVGKVLGCQAIVTNRITGVCIRCVTADFGPSTKDGENSVEACRQLGINPNPRTGGIDTADIDYLILPGVPAVVTCFDGSEFTFDLQ